MTEAHYQWRERAYGSFLRVFALPTLVDAEKVQASFKDGILELQLPKHEMLSLMSSLLPRTTVSRRSLFERRKDTLSLSLVTRGVCPSDGVPAESYHPIDEADLRGRDDSPHAVEPGAPVRADETEG
jgi:Hsp20/alpha crystallin family